MLYFLVRGQNHTSSCFAVDITDEMGSQAAIPCQATTQACLSSSISFFLSLHRNGQLLLLFPCSCCRRKDHTLSPENEAGLTGFAGWEREALETSISTQPVSVSLWSQIISCIWIDSDRLLIAVRLCVHSMYAHFLICFVQVDMQNSLHPAPLATEARVVSHFTQKQ